jgi:hypothetical protein
MLLCPHGFTVLPSEGRQHLQKPINMQKNSGLAFCSHTTCFGNSHDGDVQPIYDGHCLDKYCEHFEV